MERNYPVLVIGVVLIVAAVGGLGWWIGLRVRRARRVRSWPRVAAEVTEVRRSRESVRTEGVTQDYVVTKVRYEFHDAAGAAHTGAGQAFSEVEQGGSIEVMHHPQDPARHDIVATSPAWTQALLFSFLALVLAGIGVAVLLVGLGFD